MTNTQNHKIGAITATIINMNAMIGAGIFATPAKLATSAGPAGILTYIFVIAAVLFMALSLAKVAQIYPQEGSFYNYAYNWGGHNMGLLATACYTIGVIIALGLLTQVAALNLHTYIPSLSVNTLGIILILLVMALNIIGVRFMQVGQIFLLSCTLFALIATTILGFIKADVSNLHPFMPHGVSSLVGALSTAIFAFFGFEAATSLVNIVKDPKRNVPKAVTYSVLVVGIIYLAFISALILGVPARYFTAANMPLSETIVTAFPGYAWLAKIIGIAILTALIGVLQSMSYAVSSLAFSFFKILKSKFANNLTQSHTGFKAIIVFISTLTLINFLSIKSMGLFFNLTAIFIVFAYASAILNLVIKKHDKSLAQKAITYMGLITAAIIFISAFQGLIQELTKVS